MEIPVLVHGKGIYDSDDMKMKYTGMILEGSRIKEMGPFEELGPAYPGARVMDFSDCYILPGLVNTHVHLEFTPCRDTYGIYRREDRKTRLARAVEHAGTLLRSGVTTVRDAGSSMELIGALRGGDAGSGYAPYPGRRPSGLSGKNVKRYGGIDTGCKRTEVSGLRLRQADCQRRPAYPGLGTGA